MNSPEKQFVIIPKNIVGDGAGPRNGLIGLLDRAGYDKVGKGFDRRDQVEQGDFVFRGVKGPDALATQLELFRGRPLAILIGSDVLAEADFQAMNLGVRSDIQQLLTLGVGPCRMRFLVPKENPVNESEDLRGRLIFSKYPNVTEATLRAMRIDASVRRTEGADTRVGEYREGNTGVGAFEIVGTGETAEKNRLQVTDGLTYPSGVDLGVPYLDLGSVTTNVYASNIARAGNRSRELLRELGLSLESARTTNRFVTFKFNVPTEQVVRFADLGMKGPTVAPVMTRAGEQPWSALEISIPAESENRMRSELLRRGARDLLSGSSMDAEPSADTSEVIRILPFESEAKGATESILDPEEERSQVAEWMLGLMETITRRAESDDESSGTVRALSQGVTFCAPRFANEAQELSRAIRLEPRENAVDEAGQCLYWLLVSLRARDISFVEFLRSAASHLALDPDSARDMTEQVMQILEVSDRDMPLVGSGGMTGEAVSFADQAVEASSLLRKGGHDAAVAGAALSLKKLLRLLKLAEIDLVDVMRKEQEK